MENKKTTSISKLICFLIVLILIAAALLMYFEYSKTQSNIEALFVESRNEIAEGTLTNLKDLTSTDYAYLFKDCADRTEYDSMIDKDSREMSATELKRSLELHESCKDYFANKGNFIVDLFRTKIDNLRTQSALFGVGERSKNAEVVVKYWEDIFKLERERILVYSRLVDIQEAYWKSDLDKSLNIISSQQREALVGALNFEANQKLSRTTEIIEEAREARRVEILFWSESFGKDTEE